MIRVLHIGLSYNYGGIEQFVINYYRKVNKKKVQFDFINLYALPIAYEKEFVEMGSVIYRVADFHKNPVQYKQELSGIIKKYNVIHVHMLSAANLIPLQIAQKCGVKKIIAHSHNTATTGVVRTILHNWNYKRIHLFANIYFACSQAAGNWMFGKNIKFRVINNAINLNQFCFNKDNREKIRNELGIDSTTVLYGNIGRLNIQKNQQFLIKIFAEIQKLQPESRLCIVGEGELKEELLHLAEELNIKDKLFMLGRRLDVDSIYSAFDAIVFPSIFEGLPITLVEAQANGLKCYISKEGVPKEVKLLNSLEFMSLNQSAKQWAEKIAAGDNKREPNAVQALRSLHYDIDIERLNLEEVYQ